MWIDEYEQLMFSTENDYKKTVQAGHIKYNNMPDLFYKYCPIDRRRIESLKNDTLYFSSISSLNDLYEGAMVLPKEQVIKSVCSEINKNLQPGLNLSIDEITSVHAIIEKLIPGLNYSIDDKKEIEDFCKLFDMSIEEESVKLSRELSKTGDEIYRICCFSTEEKSSPMWAHYANNHQGFCIGYNFKELKNDLTELMLPIRYTDEMLDVTRYSNPEPNESLVINALTRKSKEWTYENEWRLIVLAKDNQKGQLEKVPTPKRIILGYSMSEYNKKKIIKIARSKNIEVYQMKMKINEYKLYPERIE